jgi:hypothetical protein
VRAVGQNWGDGERRVAAVGPEDRDAIRRAVADGRTHAEIAASFGVGKGTVFRIAHEGRSPRRPGLWDAYVAHGEHRLSLGEVLADTMEAALAAARERTKTLAVCVGPSQAGLSRTAASGGQRKRPKGPET